MIFKHPAGDREQLLRFTHSCFFWVFRRLLNCGEAILTESAKTMAKQESKHKKMWIYSVQALTVVPWNGFSSLTCRWRERVPQPDARGGDG